MEDHGSGAAAVVIAPMRISCQPRKLRDLQVSGLNLVREEEPSEIEDPGMGHMLIDIDADLELSSGKAIAQAGHALQLCLRYADDGAYSLWKAAGMPISARRSILSGTYDATVIDAGFTEIAPGTRTAAARIVV